jgi:hypothetical protein
VVECHGHFPRALTTGRHGQGGGKQEEKHGHDGGWEKQMQTPVCGTEGEFEDTVRACGIRAASGSSPGADAVVQRSRGRLLRLRERAVGITSRGDGSPTSGLRRGVFCKIASIRTGLKTRCTCPMGMYNGRL